MQQWQSVAVAVAALPAETRAWNVPALRHIVIDKAALGFHDAADALLAADDDEYRRVWWWQSASSSLRPERRS